MRDYMNFYRTQLTADVLVGDDTLSVGTQPDALASGDYFRMRMYAVDEDGAVIKSEFVDWKSDGSVTRAAEGSTEQAFDQGDWLEIVTTAKSHTEVDGALLIQYREKTGTASPVLDRFGGGWQILTLSSTGTTLDLSNLTAGQSVAVTVVGGDVHGLAYSGVSRWSGVGFPAELKPIHDLEFGHNGVEVVAFDCGGTE